MACCSAAIEASTKHVKKKVHRGKRRNKRNEHTVDNRNCNILYANISGFKSKADSVNQIVVEQNIDMLLICETRVYRNSAVQIDDFQSFPVVRQKNTGGGLYIGIRHGLCESVLSEYGKNAEFIIVRMNCKGQGLRFMVLRKRNQRKIELNFIKHYQLR